MSDDIDLGNGHRLYFYPLHGPKGGIRRSQAGVVWVHPNGVSSECEIRLAREDLAENEPEHYADRVRMDLATTTIEREIACPQCGIRGFIRDGRWVESPLEGV